MFNLRHKVLHKMFPITISKGLVIVVDITTVGRKRPHWYDAPIASLIEHLGDMTVAEVSSDDIMAWYDWLRFRDSYRHPGKKLSGWTVDSYARAVKSFFNHLITAGHLESSPAKRLRLPRLPPKGKKEISEEELARMVTISEYNPRDHAIVLVLRDSGCRCGELVTMKISGLRIVESDGQLRGRAIIYTDKTMNSRFAFFGDEACLALQKYQRVRHFDAPDDLWLTHSGSAITTSGVYQTLKRLGKRSGVEHFNPHAFRHALAKRMVNNGTPHKIIQSILGHSDITTTLNMYVSYDDDELAEHHQKWTGYQ